MSRLEDLQAELARRQQTPQKTVQAQATPPVNRLQELQEESERRSVSLGDVAEGVGAFGMEAITAANRGITGLIDTFGIDTINAALELGGFESRVPSFKDAATEPKGAFSQGTIAEGLPTDIAAGAGDFAVSAVGGQGLIRQGAKQLAPLLSSASNTGSRILRQAAQPGLRATAAFGATSGAGQEVGREVGGETGALIGSIAAPVAAVGTLAAGKAVFSKLASKFGQNIGLIDQSTGLPVPAFEKALQKKGVDFGSIVDDIDSLPALRGKMKPDEVVDSILRRKLLSGATDDVTATLKLEGNRIVNDELGEAAIKQGFRAGDVAATKGMKGETAREGLRMLKIQRQIFADSSKAIDIQPTDPAGKSLMKQFDFVRGKADSLVLDLDRIATKSAPGSNALSGPGVTPGLKGLKINTSKVEDTLIEGLNKLGIEVPKDTVDLAKVLAQKGAFKGTDISKDPTSQRIIKDAIDLLQEGGSDAFGAHKIKRQLDQMLDFNKKSAAGLTDAGKKFVGKIRKSLNDSIREVSPQYAKINDELSLSIKTMNNVQNALGPRSVDVFGENANQAVGQKLRTLLSKNQGRLNLKTAIDDLDTTARSLGGAFDTDTKKLVQFANTLDNRFGTTSDASFKGQLIGAGEQLARGQTGLKDLAAKKVIEQAEKLRGVNDSNAFNTIQKILKR